MTIIYLRGAGEPFMSEECKVPPEFRKAAGLSQDCKILTQCRKISDLNLAEERCGVLDYRVREMEGDFEEGAPISLEPACEEGADGYVSMVENAEFPAMKLEDGVLVPYYLHLLGFQLLGAHERVSRYFTMRVGEEDSSRIVPYDTSFLSGMELLEIRTGSFNDDPYDDIAYIYRTPSGETKSRIFSTELLHHDMGLHTHWCDSDDIIIASYISLYGEVDAETIELFKRSKRIKDEYDSIDSKNMYSAWIVATMRQIAKTLGADPRLYADSMRSFIEVVDRMKDHPRIMMTMTSVPPKFLVEYHKLATDVMVRIGDPDKYPVALGIFNLALKHFETPEEFEKLDAAASLAHSITRIADELSADELRVLYYLLNPQNDDLDDYERRFNKKHDCSLDEFAERVKEMAQDHKSHELFEELFSLLDWHGRIDPRILVDVGEILMAENRPRMKDIKALQESIGTKSARLLFEKFGLSRFGRYDESVIEQLADLARDPHRDRHKPFVLAVTAKDDRNGMFYWGRRFRQDPRVRTILLEADSIEEFVERIVKTCSEYGMPDSIMITAHGTEHYADFITKGAYELLAESLRPLFRKRPPQVILNSCDTGNDQDGQLVPIAQVMANALGLAVQAPEAIEGLMRLTVDIMQNGRARLHPIFAEVKTKPLALSDGGRIFVPQLEGKITPRDYGGYGVNKRPDPNHESNPIEVPGNMPDLRDGARELFRDIFGE